MSIELKLTIERGNFASDVELSLPAKGVTALFGQSGCGKTSLLRALAGLDKYSSALISFNDQVWQSATKFVPVHQRQLAFVFQDASLFTHLNVRQNLEFSIWRVPSERPRFEIDDVARLLGIERFLERSVGELSGGEQQRVSIARAVCASPMLLLMDEPLSALDRDAKREIFPYLERLNTHFNIPIVYVSHALDEVARLADHLVLMQPSGIVAHGDIQTMLTRLDLPLASDYDAESIVSAQVNEHNDDFEITYLESSIGRFAVPRKAIEIGSQVRLRIAARDVSITLMAQSDTSILNIFPATVEEISPLDNSQHTVRLSSKTTPVLAKLSKKSVMSLNLSIGKSVYIQVKGVALL